MDSWEEYDWCLFSITTTAIGFVFIQCGFTLLEAGTVNRKSTLKIIIRNILLLLISGATFWLVGYPFAYSDGGAADKIIGLTFFDSSKHLTPLSLIYIPYAAISSTIVSGGVAERCSLVAYFVYTVLITGVIQPVVTHWAWHTSGWLYVGERERYHKLNGIGFQDWSGSGVIYVVGGIAALIGAVVLGPRLGRFHDCSGTVASVKNQSAPVTGAGGCVLLVGFLVMNGGPLHLFSDIGDVLLKYIANKAISTAVAAIVSIFLFRVIEKSWSLLVLINGALTGMVAISAGCDVLEYYAACVVGLFAAMMYRLFSITIVRFQIDDPLDVSAVYFGGGSAGLIVLAFFDDSKGIVYALNMRSAHFLGWQCVGVASIAVWTALLSAFAFGLLKCFGILRVSKEVERIGVSNEGFDEDTQGSTRVEPTENIEMLDLTVNSPWYMHWYNNPSYHTYINDQDYVTRL